MIIIFLISLFSTNIVSAQRGPRVQRRPNAQSARAITSMKYRDTYIKVTYSQPARRGRKLFGGIIPYDKVWRAGANEATEITVTRMILVAGRRIPPGTYSIFVIPNRESWRIIISKQVGLWGAFDYEQGLDLFRFYVPVERVADEVAKEYFTIAFEEEGKNPILSFNWGRVRVPIQINIP